MERLKKKGRIKYILPVRFGMKCSDYIQSPLSVKRKTTFAEVHAVRKKQF